MSTYRLVTTWRIAAEPARIWDALGDPESYPQWWPGLEHVEVLAPGAADGVGRHVRVTLRSRLPYRLRFEIVARELEPPDRIVLDAAGELEGTGRWELRPDGAVTTATYTWEVATTRVWMRVLEPFLRGAFVWNHHAVMGWGGQGLAHHLGARLVSSEQAPPVRAVDWLPLAALVAGGTGAAALMGRRA